MAYLTDESSHGAFSNRLVVDSYRILLFQKILLIFFKLHIGVYYLHLFLFVLQLFPLLLPLKYMSYLIIVTPDIVCMYILLLTAINGLIYKYCLLNPFTIICK